MSDKTTAREMTLDEWVDRLPVTHRARKELIALRKAEAELEVIRESFYGMNKQSSDMEYLKEMAEAELASIKQLTYCAYCGKEFLIDSDGSEISEHIKTCEDHPMREVEADLADCYNSSNNIIKKWSRDYIDLEAELKNARASERVYRQNMSSWIDKCKTLEAERDGYRLDAEEFDRQATTFYGMIGEQDAEIKKLKAELAEANRRLSQLTHCETCGGTWADDGINARCGCHRNGRLREALEKIREHTYDPDEGTPYLFVKKIARDALKEG